VGVELAFGEWLKHRRKALGLTQDELARLVGCSAVALRKIEAEDRRPSVQIALRLTEFLRVEPKHTDAFVRFARGDLLAGQVLPAPLEAGRGATSTPRTGLPGYLTTFVGRETEVAGVIDLILREDTRLVTLIGPPGIGKTRLALRAAGELPSGRSLMRIDTSPRQIGG
jgi:transcriptional regulator with XRE-family HTH domain